MTAVAHQKHVLLASLTKVVIVIITYSTYVIVRNIRSITSCLGQNTNTASIQLVLRKIQIYIGLKSHDLPQTDMKTANTRVPKLSNMQSF